LTFTGLHGVVISEDNHRFENLRFNIIQSSLTEGTLKLVLNEFYRFQQNNDLKHTAMLTGRWMLHDVRHRLQSSPQSPDLNPIKYLWHLLYEMARKTKISVKNYLEGNLSAAWTKILYRNRPKFGDVSAKKLVSCNES
jgi:transposase